MLQRQHEPTTPAVVQPVATPEAATPSVHPHSPLSRLGRGADSTPRLQSHAAALTHASGGQLTRAGDSFRQLQQGHGNRHVQQVMDHARSASAPGPVIQPQLLLGPVDDPYERQADRVAAQVTMPVAAPAPRLGGERLMRKTTGTPVQDPASGPVDPGVQQAIQSAQGGGRPLADTVRTPLEQAMGADFSDVRVHTDARADQLNQSLQARAFTTGRDIFFRRGHFTPDNASGQSLLAHELTHTVQQGAVPPVTESTSRDEHPAHTFGGGQMLYLKPALANTVQRAYFEEEDKEIKSLSSSGYAELELAVKAAMGLQPGDHLDELAHKVIDKRLKSKSASYANYQIFAETVATRYAEKAKKKAEAKPGKLKRFVNFIAKRASTGAKMAIKGGKHAGTEAKQSTMKKLGRSNFYKSGGPSSDESHQPLTMARVDAPLPSLQSDKGKTRKAASGAVKLVAGNFIVAAAASKKARSIGNVKKKIEARRDQVDELAQIEEGAELSTTHVEEQIQEPSQVEDDGRIAEPSVGEDEGRTLETSLDDEIEVALQERHDLELLLRMANSLKGALKREALWQGTVGTVKTAISAVVAAFTGIPSAGEVLGASATEVGNYVGVKGAEAVGKFAGTKAATPLDKRFKAKDNKLDEEEWTHALSNFLTHEDERFVGWTSELLASLFLNKEKGKAFADLASRAPTIAAQFLVARQRGTDATAEFLKQLKKSHAYTNKTPDKGPYDFLDDDSR